MKRPDVVISLHMKMELRRITMLLQGFCLGDRTSKAVVLFNQMVEMSEVGYQPSIMKPSIVKFTCRLLKLVNKYPDGIAVIDLKDAYPNVMEDLQALKASGDIWLLSNTDSQEDIAYPNDFKSQIQVDDNFKALFRDIDIPSDMLDVEKELLKIGLKPMLNTAVRRAAAQILGISNNKPKQKKKKKQEISKRTKLTNAHLPELFQNLNASSS